MDPYVILSSVFSIIFIVIVYEVIPRYVPKDRQHQVLLWAPLSFTTLLLIMNILFSHSKSFAIVFVIIFAIVFFVSLFAIIPTYTKTKEEHDEAITHLIVTTSITIAILNLFLSQGLRSEYRHDVVIGGKRKH